MRHARYVLFLMNDEGTQYVRVGRATFASVAEASMEGFLAHNKQGHGNRPYLILPEGDVCGLDVLDGDFARTDAELHDAVTLDDMVILSVQELRSYLLKHGPELDTPAFPYVLYAQRYGADNCHEPHETRYGCDCWVGMTEEDTAMLLDEVADNSSTYPAFKLLARKTGEHDDEWFPSGLASAMSKLTHAIATQRLKGMRLARPQLAFLQEILSDLETSAAMYEE